MALTCTSLGWLSNMRSFSPRYFKPDDINFSGHWAENTVWPVAGSKDNVYTVEMTARGFTCDCIGMKMHGKCKHTRLIAERFVAA